MVAYKRALADADEWGRLYAFIDKEHLDKGDPSLALKNRFSHCTTTISTMTKLKTRLMDQAMFSGN